MTTRTVDVAPPRTMRTECAGTGPTQGGMHPRYADGSSSFYGRATTDPTHVRRRINGRDVLVSVNSPHLRRGAGAL